MVYGIGNSNRASLQVVDDVGIAGLKLVQDQRTNDDISKGSSARS